MLSITFDIAPVPASRPRVTRYGTYYAERYDQFRKDMHTLLLGRKKKEPYSEPLKLTVVFYVPIPLSWPKKKTEQLDGKYCVGTMDLDNLEKALYDSMNGVVYNDDKQIVHHDVKKVWINGRGRIEVQIEALQD